VPGSTAPRARPTDRVEVGTFLTVDFDTNEAVVRDCSDVVVFE
jgi:hypothetical protein